MIATNLSKSFGDRDKFIILRNSTLIGTMGTIIKNSLPRKTRKTFNTLLSGSIFNTLSLDCPFATSLLISNFFISGCQKDDIILNLLIGGYIFSIWADNYLLSHKKKAPKYTDNEVTITEDLYSIDE